MRTVRASTAVTCQPRSCAAIENTPFPQARSRSRPGGKSASSSRRIAWRPSYPPRLVSYVHSTFGRGGYVSGGFSDMDEGLGGGGRRSPSRRLVFRAKIRIDRWRSSKWARVLGWTVRAVMLAEPKGSDVLVEPIRACTTATVCGAVTPGLRAASTRPTMTTGRPRRARRRNRRR